MDSAPRLMMSNDCLYYGSTTANTYRYPGPDSNEAGIFHLFESASDPFVATGDYDAYQLADAEPNTGGKNGARDVASVAATWAALIKTDVNPPTGILEPTGFLDIGALQIEATGGGDVNVTSVVIAGGAVVERTFTNGATDQFLWFNLLDVNGDPCTSATPTEWNLYALEEGEAEAVSAALSAGTLGTHADNTMVHAGHGLYQVCPPDQFFAGGLGKRVLFWLQHDTNEIVPNPISAVLSPGSDVRAWNGTPIPGAHTAGYPIVTVKHGTQTGELLTSSGQVAADVGAWSMNPVSVSAMFSDALTQSDIGGKVVADLDANSTQLAAILADTEALDTAAELRTLLTGADTPVAMEASITSLPSALQIAEAVWEDPNAGNIDVNAVVASEVASAVWADSNATGLLAKVNLTLSDMNDALASDIGEIATASSDEVAAAVWADSNATGLLAKVDLTLSDMNTAIAADIAGITSSDAGTIATAVWADANATTLAGNVSAILTDTAAMDTATELRTLLTGSNAAVATAASIEALPTDTAAQIAEAVWEDPNASNVTLDMNSVDVNDIAGAILDEPVTDHDDTRWSLGWILRQIYLLVRGG